MIPRGVPEGYRPPRSCGTLNGALRRASRAPAPAATVPAARADEPPKRERTGAKIVRDAELHFARGEYREALSDYFEWRPDGGCVTPNEMRAFFEHRLRRVAECFIHLKMHDQAAAHMLTFAEHRALPGELDLLLVQLYREAKQYGDLVTVLDELEHRELMRTQPKWWLLTDEPRKALAAKHHTRPVRNMLDPLTFPNVPAYPAALTLPKPGSLPKALP